jgi:ABC-type polysaccharide/polyol phosphate transport system ATPase subunit
MSSDEYAVRLEKVSKIYKLYARPVDRLKEALLRGRRSYHQEFWALRDVDLAVPKGTTVAFVGVNGSGKSTLLQLAAGILQPSAGTVRAWGRVGALLELGEGFNPEHTGRENVYINGAILGIEHDEMKERMAAIVRFADIGDFIDRPVKTYSTGMYVRLAFAVAINVDPEIILIDEALSVGDMYFQHRCLTKLHELQARGKTILFVSHDPSFVVTLASKVAWIHEGRLLEWGNPERIVSQYMAMINSRELRERRSIEARPAATGAGEAESVGAETPADLAETSIPNVDVRYGNQKAQILGVGLYDEQGARINSAQAGETLLIRISAVFHENVDKPIIGFMLKNRLGLYLSGTNTLMEGHPIPAQSKRSVCTAEFRVTLPVLATGNYAVAIAVADGTLEDCVVCDWIENAYVLEIISTTLVHGLMRLSCKVEVKQHYPAALPRV